MPVKRYFLKGIDYFQLLIDHHNKRLGGPGHEARLAIFLEGVVDEKKMLETLQQNDLCMQLQSLHISQTFGLGYPAVVFKDTKYEMPITVHHVDDDKLPVAFLNKPVAVFNNPPWHLQLVYFNNGTTCLLFTFHHILFDFAGVQSFINSLAGMTDIPLLPAKENKIAFAIRFKRFFRAVFFTFREANRHMTIPERELPNKKPLKIIYHELEFSADETVAINENCKRRELQLNKSILQLAATSKALQDVIFSRQKNCKFIWVPVPVNTRKKGTKDAILLNGLSFLFYKLSPNDLRILDKTIETIKYQMKDQMRKELPKAFIDFVDGYWYMPMPFYYPMMNLPSWGKLSSFSFSALGNTFAGMSEFMGLPVTDIKNYPSNSIAPGFTFLFYEFRGKLRVMSSWVEGQFTKDEQLKVLDQIKLEMLSTVRKGPL